MVTKTPESMPATHWGTRLTAQNTGLSQTANVRIWRAFWIAAHRGGESKFSEDPQFFEEVQDIVGL